MNITRIFLGAVLIFALAAVSARVHAGQLDDQVAPMKWIHELLPERIPEPDYPDYDKNDPLEKARAQVWAGQYRRALATLGTVTKPRPIDIALLRGEARLALGRYDQALATLGDPAVASDAGVLTLRARVLAGQGKYQEAIATVQQAIAANAALIAPRYYLGMYREQAGDIAGAKSAYQWFIDAPQDFLQRWMGDSKSFTSAEDVTYIGRVLDRWATLNLVYQDDQKLNDTILGMFTRAYDLIDAEYWPAHLAAAEFHAVRDDAVEAKKESMAVLSANPFEAHAAELLGQLVLGEFDFDGADKAIDSIRKVNPDSIAADLLEARNLLLQRIPRQAMPSLERVLARQPGNVEAMGLQAGAYALLLKDDKTAEILKQVDAIDPHNAAAYMEVAEQLSSMRQYPRAAEMYKIAVQCAPWWPAARNGLGLLYTQSGDEPDARIVLEAAHSMDPYDLRTTNYLRLLDMMDKFQKKETAHFIVIYDAKLDPMIPEYFCDYLESIYKSVCGEYRFEPAQKTMIEVFPSHDAFSVRTTGAPWIATVGASTGRVIAMVTPRKGEKAMGPFNWAQVLRHEFTHTVTLGETDNRIAHWFTEGLAVQQEHSPLRWDWIPMLYQAVNQHRMFPLDSLTWAFVRPRHPIDRQLAYAESSWICQYIEETYGHEAILQMLEQFRLGHGQDEVFSIVLHRSESQFFDEFNLWCQSQVAGWGYDPETSKKYADLRAQAEKLVKVRKYPEAVPLYEQLVKLRPVDLLPHQRLAGLYLERTIHQPEKAAEQLDIIAAVDLKNDIYTKGSARIYLQLGKLDIATERALTAVYIDPYDMSAHQLLADLYDKTGNTDGLTRENRVIAELQNWEQTTQNEDAAPPATQP